MSPAVQANTAEETSTALKAGDTGTAGRVTVDWVAAKGLGMPAIFTDRALK